MAQPNRKPTRQTKSDLGLEGLEEFFQTDQPESTALAPATAIGEGITSNQLDNLLNRFGDLIALTVDQRAEANRMADQLIENQRQLIATQQILIRLMERSIELTRHITGIEERLPAVFELPRLVEHLRARVATLEGVEVY